MEEAIAKQLAIILTEERRDQWGNTVESPVSKALSEYYQKNEKSIQEKIISQFTDEQVAEKIAKKLNDKWSWETSGLEKEVRAKLVEILAQKELTKLETQTK